MARQALPAAPAASPAGSDASTIAGAPAPGSTQPPEAAAAPVEPSWDDDAGNVGIEDQTGIRFPSVQIVNGDPRMAGHFRERGAFFMSEGQINGAPVSVPGAAEWTPGILVAKNGTKIPGWFAPFLYLSLIRSRKRWTVGTGKISANFGWNEYQSARAYGDGIGDRPRSHAQGLCQIAGITEPAAITFRGMHTLGLTQRNAWADNVRRNVMIPASAIVSKRQGRRIALPSLCFTVGIGFEITPDGSPYYMTVGEGADTSQITPIALIDPATPLEADQIGRYYVGPAARAVNEELYRLADAWIGEWAPEALAAYREGRGIGVTPAAVAGAAPGRKAPEYKPERDDTEEPAAEDTF